MNRQNNKNYAQAAAQSKTNNNTHHQNQQHHHQQAPQQNQTSGTSTSSNFSSSANGKTINKSQMKPQAQHNSTMGNGNTGRSTPIKKNPVQLPANGHSWEKRTSTSIEFGSINTPNAQISSLPTSTGPTLTSGGGIPSSLPTKGVPTFGTLSNTTTPTIQAAQTTPTTIGTSGPGANNNNNNSNSNNNNNNNGVAPKPISARAGEIPRTHSAPPQFQDNRNVRQSGHLTNVPCTNNIHQQQSTAVSHQQSSASVSNPPINHRKDSVSSTVSSNDGQPPFHPHHSPHHPSHTHNHHYPRQHHNHKPNMVPPNQYRPRDNKNVTHPSQHLNPAQSVQAGVMPMTGPQLWNYPRVNEYAMPYFTQYNPPMFIPPQYAMQPRPPQMQTHLSQVPSVAFKPPSTTTKQSKAIEIIDPSKGAPIQFKTQPQSKSPLKREESPPAVVFDKKPEESDKEKSSSAVPIVDPAEKDKEARERKEREEQDRIAKEKVEQERKEKEEKERKEREEQERIAKEKEEQERIAKEKEEQERRERVEREERERKEREERERKEREEREERERKEREERERKEREERERKEREERERKEREERERKEREERERKEREEQERLEAERKEKEEKERKEREEREKREREEREERERIAKEEQERKEREEKERLEKERLEAERIEKEKERKEAEEKARKEQEEKKEKEEVERKKKEEEEAKAKATAEGEKKKEKEAESNDSKKEEKKYGKGNRPGPLDLSRTTSAPAIPSAPLSALGSARKIDDINSVQYPEGISSPNPALNANSEPGKFKYDRSFLMQFMGVCKEKPENLPALEAIGMDEPKDDRKKTRPSTSRSNSLHKNTQFTNMGEFKITPKTSEERFAQSNLRNGSSSSLFGRAPLGRTGSGSTLLPTPAMSATPQSPSRTSSGRGTPRKGGKGTHQMQGNMGEHIAPLERSENRWVPGDSLIKSDSLELDSIRRKVKALLNKLTLEKFDSISDQIIEYANKSRDERDGRILREVIRLIFEKSCDESNFCAMYAQLCRKMMERVDPEIVDENVKNTEGKFVQGGTLFRKYLLNRCQEDFEKGWKVNIPVPSNEKGEPDLMSDEYYVAAKAKRQGLGLIRFIGELFKLNMLTERIMHECIKKLLIFQGSPEEEEMESLCKLMNTVGEQLDHVKTNQHEQIKANQIDHAKAKQLMENYFNRMEEISKLPNLSSRIKFMIMDVIDLRSNAWKPRRDINAPKTIAEIHEDAAKQKEEAEFLRRTASSGGKLPKISEQMSRSGSGRRDHKGMTSHGSPGNDGWINVGGASQRKDKVGDLTKFGSVNRGKITNFSLAPGGLPLSGGAKGWKSDSKVDDHKTTVLSRTNSLNSTSNTYSLLESSEGRKSSELSTSEAPKPSPPTERKKLNLTPRTKPIATEEPQTADKSASKSNSEMVSLAQPMSEELAVKKINNMMEEYFSVLDIQEVIHCLKEIPAAYHARTIELFASKVIEQKQKDVDNVTKLFKEIVSSETCNVDTFKNGFSSTLEFLMDIGADAPMSYSFTGQLLFSAGLDFRDISKLLVPLDDDKSVEKIVKGYASALKNDVDEQKYVQKINEFDFKLLFPKKNKDDINKYLEDLGLGSSKK